MSVAGTATIIGANEQAPYDATLKPSDIPADIKGKRRQDSTVRMPTVPESLLHNFELGVEALEERPFFVKINAKDGVIGALKKLDQQLKDQGEAGLLSKKEPISWIGRELIPGQVGLVNHGGLPKLLLRPGRYPPFPLRNWIARQYVGAKALSETVIEFQGLIIVQVSQNQAAVICDPQNKVFVIKNGGFAALSLAGAYTILAVVDQTHLTNVVRDKVTKAVLGYTQEIKMTRNTGRGGGDKEFVVALFLDIPANNCAILQKGNDLIVIPAGQHYVVDPSITLRGMFTFGENQLEMPTKDIFTRDQVPVSLTIYLKWQLMEPLKLTQHGYSTAYEALRDKTQSILTQVVSHLDYSAMIKQRQIGPDIMEENSESNAAFLDALRTSAMDELIEASTEYGIVLKDLAVIDRQFKGDIAATMDKLTTRALQAQVEAANVDRENSNLVKKEQGKLEVARVQAQTRKTEADAKAYTVVAAAKADAEALKIQAEAQAEATKIAAAAEADAILSRGEADRGIVDGFAREMSKSRMEVRRVEAFGNRTVFVPTETSGNGGIGSAMAMGLGMAQGMGSNK
ncbi:hypothetical protein CPB86DRAFT_816683 [Serendipita vermifera]|nr:hypothetical protein CPB86DRAFT_816683 [Serendipita vermifera]